MSFKKLRENKAVMAAIAAALCATVLMGSMVIFAQGKTEEKTGEIIGEGEEIYFPSIDWTEDTLYKDTEENQELVKQVCEKYGLDYETATLGDITPEIADYEFAVRTIAEEGELPLFVLPEHDGYARSLEAYVDDIHAFRGSKAIIETVCERDGIDPETAVIRDLTVEQIMEIMAEAFETSDHGK